MLRSGPSGHDETPSPSVTYDVLHFQDLRDVVNVIESRVLDVALHDRQHPGAETVTPISDAASTRVAVAPETAPSSAASPPTSRPPRRGGGVRFRRDLCRLPR